MRKCPDRQKSRIEIKVKKTIQELTLTSKHTRHRRYWRYRKETELEVLFSEIMSKHFPNLKKEKSKYRKGQTAPNTWTEAILTVANQSSSLQANIKNTYFNVHLRNTRSPRGTPAGLTADFSPETLRARRHCRDIIQNPKEKNCQPRLIYPAKLPIVYENEIKTFQSKQKLKNFPSIWPALQVLLKDVLQTQKENDTKDNESET